MKIIDASNGMFEAFMDGCFDLDRWSAYIDGVRPGIRELCIGDMNECLDAGISWEGMYLPVLDAALSSRGRVRELSGTFRRVTDGLDDRLIKTFGKTVDIDIILYLGLCNGAGWVTEISGRTVMLLGIEKILELGWDDPESFNGLILHELGHCYQAQYGILHRDLTSSRDRFLWQLFTEGIANVFERLALGDPDHYPQYSKKWLEWCRSNLGHIARSFDSDLDVMSFETQRYFGDWVRFEGYPDVGYYLGTRFIRYLLDDNTFDSLLSWSVDEVRKAFKNYLSTFD